MPGFSLSGDRAVLRAEAEVFSAAAVRLCVGSSVECRLLDSWSVIIVAESGSSDGGSFPVTAQSTSLPFIFTTLFKPLR